MRQTRQRRQADICSAFQRILRSKTGSLNRQRAADIQPQISAQEIMPSFPKSRRERLAEARAGNAFIDAMYGDGKPPQIVYPPEKPKRKRSVRDELVPSEHQAQCAVISWWRLACVGDGLPEFALFAVPNG